MGEEIKDEVLEQLLKKDNAIRGQIAETFNRMHREIENRAIKIREIYDQIRKPIYEEDRVLKDKIKKHLEEHIKYSTFKNKVLGDVLQDLIIIFEGEKYCYQETNYHTEEIDPLSYNGGYINVTKNIRVIVKESEKKKFYKNKLGFDEVKHLVNNGHMLVIEESKDGLKCDVALRKQFKNRIYDSISYNGFDYVKEFLDGVIKYRIKNKITDISKEDMNELLRQYILSKREIIESSNMLRFDEKEKLYQEEIEQDKTEFSKRLEMILKPHV